MSYFAQTLCLDRALVCLDQQSDFGIVEINDTRGLVLLTVVSVELYLALYNCDNAECIRSHIYK